MPGKILRDLFDGIPVRFASAYPLEESIERLRSQTMVSVFSGLFRERAVGRVSEQKVKLQRVAPFFGNSFKPVFRGKFKRDANGIALEGKFTRFLTTKLFMGFGFGFSLLWILFSSVISLGTALKPDKTVVDYAVILMPVLGVGIVVLGYLLARFGWWWSRGDIDYLSAVITQALCVERTPPGEA